MSFNFIGSAVAASALAFTLNAHADVIAQWNFNDSNLVVDLGSGSAAHVGGTTTSGFNSGGGSSDPAQPGIGWSISSFAAQSSGDLTRGASFTVSTLGMQDVVFSYDIRHSNTAAQREVVQYSTDGVNFTNLAAFSGNNGGAAQPLWFNGRSVDLSAISAADNQANLTLRVLAAFEPGTGAYASSQPGSNYGTTGTWRFDMVTISAVAAVPEPESYAMMLAGLLTLVGVARRRGLGAHRSA